MYGELEGDTGPKLCKPDSYEVRTVPIACFLRLSLLGEDLKRVKGYVSDTRPILGKLEDDEVR